MQYDIKLESVQSELIAAVRATVPLGDIPRAWKPALDQVWAFLKKHEEIGRQHNLFLYHHPERRNEAMNIDFGVQVTRMFEREGDVRCVQTPIGEVVTTVHIGPYQHLHAAHDALHAWCASHNRKIGPASWEIYGDWTDDPARQETTIKYLLSAVVNLVVVPQ
jgi:effector-binding domain-containing protein